jgi:hypothetical protein
MIVDAFQIDVPILIHFDQESRQPVCWAILRVRKEMQLFDKFL